MNDNKNNKLVNWQDCMNVSSAHFKQTEDFFLDYISEGFKLCMTPSSYGLLPLSGPDFTGTLRLSDQVNESVKVDLLSCKAITSSGIRINFKAEIDRYGLNTVFSDKLIQNVKGSKVKFYNIILVAEPFDRTPSGELDPLESPPRQPNVEFSYKLSVVPVEGETKDNNRIKGHSLIIGRIRKSSSYYELDQNFIPACISMSAHKALKQYYEQFYQLFTNLIRYSKIILSKINGSYTKESILPYNISLMCKEILRYSSGIYFDFRNNGLNGSPIKTVEYFSSIAHAVFMCLSYYKESDKEELLKYFYEWSDVTPGSLEEMLTNMINIDYDHENIRTIMLQVESFLRTFTELWGKLSQLEFIGKHKENIVVSERIQSVNRESKTGYTFLD